MEFKIHLATPSSLLGTKESIERITREGFTAKDVGIIVGLDKLDEGAILVSRESWSRLEVFMALLSGVEMSISEEKLKAIISWESRTND
jgi:hypothetical protein